MANEKEDTYHPFRNLLVKTRALLNADLRLHQSRIPAHQWQLLVQIDDQTVMVGKGGMNTMFCQFGKDSKRRIMGPMDMIDMLKWHAKQRYVLYKIGKVVVWKEKTALKTAPKRGLVISGLRADGKYEDLWEAHQTLTGTEWKRVQRGSKKPSKNRLRGS